MPHSAKIIADSITQWGERLISLEVKLPRVVLAEFNTHRVFSRNSASSRAIPVEKMLRMVEEDPYIPTHWGQNQKGMQADVELDEAHQTWAVDEWMRNRDAAINGAGELLRLGVHKQITNRLLEPFMWHTVVVTATEWSNWTHLRDNKMAHPEIQALAVCISEAISESTPKSLRDGEWHLPFVSEEEMNVKKDIDLWKKVSSGRCARVSYLTHDGVRDPQADVDLHDRLLTAGHMSPFEHVARPMAPIERECTKRFNVFFEDGTVLNQVTLPTREFCESYGLAIPRTWEDWTGAKIKRVQETHFCGNFDGFIQYRKEIPFEWDIMGEKS